jgi:hypothetical protein
MRPASIHKIKIYLEEPGLYNEPYWNLLTSSQISGIQMGEISKLG